MKLFQTLDKRAVTDEEYSTKLNSKHQNTITWVRKEMSGNGNSCTVYSLNLLC